MSTVQQVIDQTVCWVEKVVIGCNFCPFAKRELDRGSIRYRVINDTQTDACLQAVIDECVYLDANDTTETTLLIFSTACIEFDAYLLLLEMAEKLIIRQGYGGVYQLASFHPEYIFAESLSDDAANYTNRSPYPMFHLIREASMEIALQHYPEPEKIPERNVECARKKGLKSMKSLLDSCGRADKK